MCRAMHLCIPDSLWYAIGQYSKCTCSGQFENTCICNSKIALHKLEIMKLKSGFEVAQCKLCNCHTIYRLPAQSIVSKLHCTNWKSWNWNPILKSRSTNYAISKLHNCHAIYGLPAQSIAMQTIDNSGEAGYTLWLILLRDLPRRIGSL